MRRGTVKTVNTGTGAITIAGDGSTATMPVSYWLPGSFPLVGDRVLYEVTDGEIVVFGNLTGGNAETGQVLWLSHNQPAQGLLLCDGTSYLRASFPRLSAKYSLDGFVWGTVDGTHFNVPNLTDQFIRANGTLGNEGGSSTHDHTVADHQHNAGTLHAEITVVGPVGINRVAASAWNETHEFTATGQSTNTATTSRSTAANVSGNTTNGGPGSTGSANHLPPYTRLKAYVRI